MCWFCVYFCLSLVNLSAACCLFHFQLHMLVLLLFLILWHQAVVHFGEPSVKDKEWEREREEQMTKKKEIAFVCVCMCERGKESIADSLILRLLVFHCTFLLMCCLGSLHAFPEIFHVFFNFHKGWGAEYACSHGLTLVSSVSSSCSTCVRDKLLHCLQSSLQGSQHPQVSEFATSLHTDD